MPARTPGEHPDEGETVQEHDLEHRKERRDQKDREANDRGRRRKDDTISAREESDPRLVEAMQPVMTDDATIDEYNRILSAMMVMQVRTARALSIVLSDDYVDMDTRQHLQASLGMSANALAIELDRIRPGGGDALLRLYVEGIDVPDETDEQGG